MTQIETCNEFRTLISADVDGELDEREQVELRHHLQTCPACQRWQLAIRRLSEPLAELPLSADQGPEKILEIHANGYPQREDDRKVIDLSNRIAYSATHWGWFAAVAAVLIVAVGGSLFMVSRRETPTSPAISVEPLVAMHAINVQSEQDQQALLRTLELDLRMMKLEMRNMDLDPAARQQLGNRIESLLAKTRQMDSSTPISFRGEMP